MSSPQQRAPHAPSPRGWPELDDSARAPRVPRMYGQRRGRALVLATRVVNPLMMRFAGSRWFPLYALLRHRGRRSGHAYATPVVAVRLTDGFLVPMAVGENADWVRNVRAAGGCALRWRGSEYDLVAPEVVDLANGKRALAPILRLLLPVFRPRGFMHLRHARTHGAAE